MAPWLIWFLVGIGLAFVELMLPGFILLFFSIGCLVTAGASLLFDLSFTGQLSVFIVTSIVSLLSLRKWLMSVFRGKSSNGGQTEFDDFPFGVRVTVIKTITPEISGRIQYRGAPWDAVAAETIEAGSTVEIERYGDSRHVFFVRKIQGARHE